MVFFFMNYLEHNSQLVSMNDFATLQYLTGFGSEVTSEDPRCPGSLPKGQVTTSSCSFTYRMQMNDELHDVTLFVSRV